MKKLSKVLLVTLVLALLCSTVFSAVASAAVSDNEAAVKAEIASLGSKVDRVVEDFTDEEIDVKANVNRDTPYADRTDKDSVGTTVFSNLLNTPTGTSNVNESLHFGQWHAVSQLGLTYGELRLPERYNYQEGDNLLQVNPLIRLGASAAGGWAINTTYRYVTIEWDMATATQYPAGFGIYTEMANATATTSFVQKIGSADAEGNLTVGEGTVSMGEAKEWHHYTFVLYISAARKNNEAVGAFYQDGKLVSKLDAPTNNDTLWTRFKSLMIGYYNEQGDFVEDSTINIDNVVYTRYKTAYHTTAGNLLKSMLVDGEPLEDITSVGGVEFVWDADYQLPEEAKYVGVKADGEVSYFLSFEEAYEAYLAGGLSYIEIHKDTEAAIDAPVVIMAAPGVTFVDTAATVAHREAVDKADNRFYTFYETDASINYTFYNNKEGAEGILSADVAVSVGSILAIDPENLPIVPENIINNPEDAKSKLQFDGTWQVWRVVEGEEPVLVDFSLVFQADIDAGVRYEVYPNYQRIRPFFDVSYMNEGVEVVDTYLSSADYVTVFENIADGATVTFYRDIGFTATPVINKTLYIDMNGCALYQNNEKKINVFELAEGANLYLYSSTPGAAIFTGYSVEESSLVFDYTARADVHIGYQNAEAKDAYLDNLTLYVGTLADITYAASTMDVAATVIYVANAQHDALLGFGPGAQDVVATFAQVTIYNNTPVAKSLASFEDTLGSNSMIIENSVIHTTAAQLVSVITTVAEAEEGAEDGEAAPVNPNANQTVVLNNTVIYGAVVGDAQLPVALGLDCRFASYDPETVSLPEGAVLIFDNRSIVLDAAYPSNAQFINRTGMVTMTDRSAIITTCISTADVVTDTYCEVEWYFDETVPSIKEYWVRGIIPEFRHEFPVSEQQRITYTYVGVGIGVIPEDAATLRIEAKERAVYELIGFAHNLSIHLGMNYYFYIPVESAVFSVARGAEAPVEVSTLPLTEDGQYYIFTVAEMEVRNFATTAYQLNFVIKTLRGTELPVKGEAVPVKYLESLFESEETTQETKDLVITFMNYIVEVAKHLSTEEDPIDTSSVQKILKGKAVPAAAIDYLSDEGGIRYGLQGAYLNLKSCPAFVYVIRPGFTGMITINGIEHEVVDGLYNGEDRIYYTVETLGDLADEMNIVISGQIGEVVIEKSGNYSLSNFYVSLMDDQGNTPSYISALYAYVKYAKAYQASIE